MAGTVARVIDFRIGTAGAPSVLTDISGKTVEASLDRDVDTPESTTFNSGNAKSFAPGLTGATIDGSVNWDAVIDAHLKGLVGLGALVSWQLGEIGNGAGNPKSNGVGILSKLGKPQKVGDIMQCNFAIQVSGPITDSVY